MSSEAEGGAGGEGSLGLTRDFSILAPPKRTAILAGESIDVSFIPARVAIKFLDFSRKYPVTEGETKPEDFNPEMLEDMVEIIALICQKSSPKITKDFLLDSLDLFSLMEFIKFVFESLGSGKTGGAGGAGEVTGAGEGDLVKN